MCFRSTSSIDSSSVSLELDETFDFASTRFLTSAIPKKIRFNLFTGISKYYRTLNSILKFSYIPRPMMRYNCFLTFFRKEIFSIPCRRACRARNVFAKSKISSLRSFKAGTAIGKHSICNKGPLEISFLHLLQKGFYLLWL